VGRRRSDGLTAAESRVAELVERHTNREIAAALGLSEKTVEARLSRIYRKLGLRSRTELALLANEARREGKPLSLGRAEVEPSGPLRTGR
jgi:DNA-binding NarL/FixJ family response regulator